MRKQIILPSIFLGTLALISRIPFVEHFQSHWDGPQYSIAVLRYSFIQQTPAPPGYPLYIALGKFFYLFCKDPHIAMLSVSILGSVLSTVAIFYVGSKLYHFRVGLAASLIVLSGSTFYYFGLTPYPYGLLPFATLLVAYATYLSFIKRNSVGILLGIATGILFGIRPQEILVCGPLCIVGFVYLSNKQKVLMLLVSIGIFILWFIPLTAAVGGLGNYIAISQQFSKGALRPSFMEGTVNYTIMIKGFLLSVGISAFFLLYYFTIPSSVWFRKKLNIQILLFYLCWILPGFLFNLFIRSDHAGYQMGYITAFVLLIAVGLWQYTKNKRNLYYFFLCCIVIFNLIWFFYNRDPHYTKPYRPTSFHYSDIRKNDLKVGSKVAFIEQTFKPNSSLLITTDTLWRPYMYYFKSYHLVDLSGLDIPDTGYKYIRFDAYQWDITQSQNTSLTVLIPHAVTHIIFTDDTAYQWIKNYPFKKYALPGNSSITVLSVNKSKKIRYNYHWIYVQ